MNFKKIILLTLFFTLMYAILVRAEEVQYTKEEIEIAKTIAMEACGEGYIGMYGVSNVIANRSKKWNKTPYEIVSQKNQFVGFTHKNRNKRFEECKTESLYLAHNIMKLKDITKKALYFKTKYEQKRKWHKIKTITIKNHEFYH